MDLTKSQLKNILNIIDTQSSNYRYFVETGTFGGRTIKNLHNIFKKLYTIEISETLYKKTKNKLNHLNNINFILGDSSIKIKEVLNNIEDKCIFWLDGHWSGGITGKGECDVPLIDECKSIDELYKFNECVIIIDDYRLFNTNKNENWLGITKENIESCFVKHKIKKSVVINDRLVLSIIK